jgi:cytochrome c oxidase assembly protein Cox11
MRFIVGRELPKNVGSINLSYALFDITDRVDLSAIQGNGSQDRLAVAGG